MSYNLQITSAAPDVEALAESLPVIMWLGKGADGSAHYFNRKWHTYTGLSHADSIQTGWMDAVHPDDRTRVFSCLSHSAQEQEVSRIELRLRGIDGLFRWFLAHVTSKSQFENNDPKWIWIFIDIDDSKKAHNTLQILNNTSLVLTETLDYETVLKAIAILVLESIADLCIIDLLEDDAEARSFKRVISMHRDLSKDKIAIQLKSFPPRARAGDLIFDAITNGTGKLLENLEDELNGKYNQHRYYQSEEHARLLKALDSHSAIVVPLTSHGTVFGALSLIRSKTQPLFTISDIPLFEEVARRTALAIENARLYQRAQKTNEAKTEFLANVSHEIRTPLGAILGFTEILCAEEVDEAERRRYLEIIRRNSRQLSELIGDLLDLSKVEAGKLDLNNTEFSIKAAMEEIVALFSLKAAEKGISIQLEISDAVPEKIVTDHLRLMQIMINIIGNAVKFSSDGVISIRIQLLVENEVPLISIVVCDHGIGIAPGAQDKIFQAFVQADSTMTRRFGGTGLGLLLARRLAQALGGNVELLWSEVKKGSAFRVTFNPKTMRSSASATEVKAPSADSICHAPHRSGRILVVDDSLDNQVLLGRMLKNSPLKVDFANNGVEGIKMGATNVYDLIFMDIQMPVVDGYTAVTRLREKGLTTPIVALTAHALQEDKVRCLSAGCNDYMTKPVDAIRLHEVIARYIGEGAHV